MPNMMSPKNFYEMRQCKLNPPPPLAQGLSFENRTILLTGASGGVGLAAGLLYAKHKVSHLILAVRRPDAGEATATKIKEAYPKTRITVMQVDMGSYGSIQTFVQRIENEIERLDVAVLNAGVMKTAPTMLASGWEETIGVNALGTALLGLLLLPKLRAARPELQAQFNALDVDNKGSQFPHLVFVSSRAQFFTERKDLPSDDSPPLRHISNRAKGKSYDMGNQYVLSKLALQWAAAKLKDIALGPNNKDPEVIVTTCCPGPTRSDLGRDVAKGPLGFLVRPGLEIFMKMLMRTSEEGARDVVAATVLGTESHGVFWMDNAITE